MQRCRLGEPLTDMLFSKCGLCGKGRPEARHMVTYDFKNGKDETPYPCSRDKCPFGFFRQTDAMAHSKRAGKKHRFDSRLPGNHYSKDSLKYRKLFNILR